MQRSAGVLFAEDHENILQLIIKDGKVFENTIIKKEGVFRCTNI